ncbi:hypothetical protein KFE25_003435 [Diacronema lutheri]|uniref:Histidine phosphatase family protein n=1 Tax=Diacronema lutheri TaxID=2081491 RepID=A0A8J5XMC3_DIALT|nr:hypothetical protein KFE25_003435 [Diacronema lutheri]
MQHISEVHISPTLRTLQTARPIMARLPGVRAEVVLDIFEVGGVYNANVTSGEAEGQPGVARAAMSEFGYGLPDGVTEDGWYAREHGKETKAEGVARASKVAARLRETAAALPTARKTIALVSHGDFIGMLLANLLGHGRGDASVGLAFKVYNTGVSIIDINGHDGSVRVLMVNSVAHLQPNQYRAAHLGVV